MTRAVLKNILPQILYYRLLNVAPKLLFFIFLSKNTTSKVKLCMRACVRAQINHIHQ